MPNSNTSLRALRKAMAATALSTPQADAAYRSLLGTYAAGEAGVAQVLLAQQTVLELRVAHAEAASEHAQAWAALEAQCGQPLDRKPFGETP